MVEETEIQTKALSMPSDVWARIDARAAKWQTNRSAAMRRIFLEWEETQSPTLTPAPVAEAEPVKETI